MSTQSVPENNGYTATSAYGAQATNKPVFFRRPKSCPLSDVPSSDINYKNIKLLTRFISEGGRILPSRITSVSTSKQRELKVAIKRARSLALLPFAQK
jgi:small subunit ribosomal protein S18